MPLFKDKKSAKSAKALNKVQAKVSPAPNAIDPLTGNKTFIIEIEGHMGELVSDGVNSIEISVEDKRQSDNAPTTVAKLNQYLQNAKKQSSYKKSTKVIDVDPKEFISHDSLASLDTPGAAMAAASSLGDARLKPDVKANISDNIIKTQVTFQERPMDRKYMRDVLVKNDFIDGKLSDQAGKFSCPENRTVQKSQNPICVSVSSTSPPKIKKASSVVVPRLTTKTLTVSVAKNDVPVVNIKDSFGRKMGQVRAEASGVVRKPKASKILKHRKFFKRLVTNRKLFDISVIDDGNRHYLCVTSKHRDTFDGFCIYYRKLTRSPGRDRTYKAGEFTFARAFKIPLKIEWNCKYKFYIIPTNKGEKICYSESYVHQGTVEEHDVDFTACQINNAVRFLVRNVPLDCDVLYAQRLNETTGVRSLLRRINMTMSKEKLDATPRGDAVIAYNDSYIGDINYTYSYDFFAQTRFGLQKHLFRHTIRTYERDTLGHIFSNARVISAGGSHKIIATMKFPDPYIPKDENYSLYNPDDEFIEACRNRRRVCLLQIRRHSDTGEVDDLGIHTLNPGELNTLNAKINNNSEFSISLVIDGKFLKAQGAEPVYNASRTYYYELRLGSYLLANQLSFLENPLKLNVPNEFTDGKTGYQYDPIVYESPLRRDYGIVGRVGMSKKTFLLESLTSTSRMLATEPGKGNNNLPITLNAKLVDISRNSKAKGVLIQAQIPDQIINSCDHFELFVSDSTTGSYTTLGKSKLVQGSFYYIDAIGPRLAANKLKYLLVGRDARFDNVIQMKSEKVDISATNIREETIEELSSSTKTAAQNRKSRGLRQ